MSNIEVTVKVFTPYTVVRKLVLVEVVGIVVVVKEVEVRVSEVVVVV